MKNKKITKSEKKAVMCLNEIAKILKKVGKKIKKIR